jgi:hypothetical protein
MNRLAEKVVPVMNDDEVQALLLDHYRGEAQTLTTGTEANLLKFRELLGLLTAEEQARWDDIKKTFRRNQLTRGAEGSDAVGRVVAQLADFRAGLQAIGDTLEKQLSRPPAPLQVQIPLDLGPLHRSLDALREAVSQRPAPAVSPAPTPAVDLDAVGRHFADGLRGLREELARALSPAPSGGLAERVSSLSHELEMIHSTLATLKDLAAQQRDHLRQAQELLVTRAKQGTVEIDLTQEMLSNERAFLERFHQVLEEARQESPPPAPDAPPAGNPPPPPLP